MIAIFIIGLCIMAFCYGMVCYLAYTAKDDEGDFMDMKEESIREKALELHRQMWTDMKRDLGDCPTACQRVIIKKDGAKATGIKG